MSHSNIHRARVFNVSNKNVSYKVAYKRNMDFYTVNQIILY